MKRSSVYSGRGDQGMTSLAGGLRVPKTHVRMEACGTVDELNSLIGLLLTEVCDRRIFELMQIVQCRLFSIGSYLSSDGDQPLQKPSHPITLAFIQQLEQNIDLFDGELPELRGFVLPGGCRSAALAHTCRTVCRRAEREIFRLKEVFPIEDTIPVFINRLSDLLFVIARLENFHQNSDEIIWNNICK
ncbi:MAG: cob(I)yrinic acid a,c-diamide adenosyltransferase [Tannerella sp.]|jgi:cob(I)alamin adenosyltransferase|nr:cob(I)yrinic acid a,c-diamide adenosyltransferase [Tannerella sp.]